jgi:dephospho-CoA kinase
MIATETTLVRGRRIIGLTGGIAMGKTMVSSYLATVHCLPVLDADILARTAVELGTPMLATIADRYGSGILLPNGQLNRQQLGAIVFNSAAERLWLEQCIHPYVRDRLLQAIHTPPLDNIQQHPIIVMVIPLLFEARMTDLVTEIWVVTCVEEQQLKRIMERDHLTQEQAKIRIRSQLPIRKKMSRADVILENNSSLEALQRQVDQHLKSSASETFDD